MNNQTTMTPTQELGKALCFTRLGIALMNTYVFGDGRLFPLFKLADELQRHLDGMATAITAEKKAFGQARIDTLRAALKRVDALTEDERHLDRQVVRNFPAYQLGPSAYMTDEEKAASRAHWEAERARDNGGELTGND